MVLNLEELGREKQTKPKANRRKGIKVRVKINKIENRKTTEKIKETKNWFFKKINKIDRLE